MSAADDGLLIDAARRAFADDRPLAIGVAVSGGSDSMATLHLLAQAAPVAGWRVSAVTVDHGLRPDAAAEAAFVADACAELGVPHETVQWQRTQTTGNLQDQARRARMALVAGWARGHGITHVALGHTAGDQAEGFLMNLARGAGIDGLSGMRRDWHDDGITWSRPFLRHTRQELRDWLTRRAIAWVEDPSNTDTRYQRVKARQVLAALSTLGIDAQGLAGVADNLNQARAALAQQAHDAARQIANVDQGDVIVDRQGLAEAPSEVARRVLIAALRWIAGGAYPPRESGLAAAMQATSAGKNHTLAGCRILTGSTQLRITREASAVRDMRAAPGTVWDGRWRIDGPDRSATIATLGPEGLQHCPAWRATGRPHASLIATPAVWSGDTLIGAPLAGLKNGWTATLLPKRADFFVTLLSH